MEKKSKHCKYDITETIKDGSFQAVFSWGGKTLATLTKIKHEFCEIESVNNRRLTQRLLWAISTYMIERGFMSNKIIPGLLHGVYPAVWPEKVELVLSPAGNIFSLPENRIVPLPKYLKKGFSIKNEMYHNSDKETPFIFIGVRDVYGELEDKYFDIYKIFPDLEFTEEDEKKDAYVYNKYLSFSPYSSEEKTKMVIFDILSKYKKEVYKTTYYEGPLH